MGTIDPPAMIHPAGKRWAHLAASQWWFIVTRGDQRRWLEEARLRGKEGDVAVGWWACRSSCDATLLRHYTSLSQFLWCSISIRVAPDKQRPCLDMISLLTNASSVVSSQGRSQIDDEAIGVGCIKYWGTWINSNKQWFSIWFWRISAREIHAALSLSSIVERIRLFRLHHIRKSNQINKITLVWVY